MCCIKCKSWPPPPQLKCTKNILKKLIKFCSYPPSFWTGGKLSLHPHWKPLPIRR